MLAGTNPPPSAEAEAAGDGATLENRPADPRHPPDAVPEITALRVSPGDTATLINISASGVLLESGTRYAPGVTVTLHFEGTLEPKQISARIVRCQVSSIGAKGTLQYQTALAFDRRLALAADAAHAPGRDAASAPPVSPFPTSTVANRW
jgi:hypothetical protein